MAFRTVALVLLGAAGVYAQDSKTPIRAESGWRVIRHTDPMTDKKQVALALRAIDAPAALRVGCSSDGVPQLYLTVPKTLRVKDVPFGEFRFDKEPAIGFTLMDVSVKSVGDELGASATDDIYRVGTPDETTKHDPIRMLRTASRLAYDLSLLRARAKGSAGAFNVAGFERAAAAFADVCPLRAKSVF